eukprot:705773-Pyramimonas_sp.AAC.1
MPFPPATSSYRKGTHEGMVMTSCFIVIMQHDVCHKPFLERNRVGVIASIPARITNYKHPLESPCKAQPEEPGNT